MVLCLCQRWEQTYTLPQVPVFLFSLNAAVNRPCTLSPSWQPQRETGGRLREAESFGLMGFSCRTEAGVTVNQQDESFEPSLKCVREAFATRLCPIRGKWVRLVLVCEAGGAASGWPVRGNEKFRERLITLEGSFSSNPQRQTLSLYRSKEEVTSWCTVWILCSDQLT